MDNYCGKHGTALVNGRCEVCARAYEIEPESSWTKLRRFAAAQPRLTVYAILMAIGGVYALVSNVPEVVERFSPSLNEAIHSNVTDEADSKYQMRKVAGDIKKWEALTALPTDTVSDLKKLQSAMAANLPVLEDGRRRLTLFRQGFAKEEADRLVPEACKVSVHEALSAYDEYFAIQARSVGIVRAVNLEDAGQVQKFLVDIVPVNEAEDTNGKRLDDWTASWERNPHVCDGY